MVLAAAVLATDVDLRAWPVRAIMHAMRSKRSLLTLAWLLAACPSTSPPQDAVPASKPASPPLTDVSAPPDPPDPGDPLAQFRLTLEEFNWETSGRPGIVIQTEGTAVVISERFERVNEGGKTYTSSRMHRHELKLSAEDVDAIRSALRASGFFEQPALFKDPVSEHGSHATYTLQAGAQRHKVVCDSGIPDTFLPLAIALRELQDRTKGKAGIVLTEAQVEAFWDAGRR